MSKDYFPILLFFFAGCGTGISFGNFSNEGEQFHIGEPEFFRVDSSQTQTYSIARAWGNKNITSAQVSYVRTGTAWCDLPTVSNDQYGLFILNIRNCVGDGRISVLIDGKEVDFDFLVSNSTAVYMDAPQAIALLQPGNLTYVIDRGIRSIYRIDVNTGIRTVLSGPGVGTGPTFDYPRNMVLKPNGVEAVVIDAGLHSVIGVNLVTGDRTVLSDPVLGSGLALVNPTGLALAGPNLAYVMDPNQKILFAVDLTNGDRTIVSSNAVGSGPNMSFPTGIRLSQDGTKLFAIDITGNNFMTINISTGDRVVISGPSDSVGLDTNLIMSASVILNKTEDVAHIANYSRRTIVRIDLASGQRSVISSASVGVGPMFRDPVNIQLSEDPNIAFLSDVGYGAVFKVDLLTGNRTVLADSGRGGGIRLDYPTSLSLNSSEDKFYVTNPVSGFGSLIEVDLVTGNRIVTSSAQLGAGSPFLDPQDHKLSVTGNTSFVIDRNTKYLSSVDLTTGNRTLVSGGVAPNEAGLGSSFNDPIGMALNEALGIALVVDQGAQALFSVFLATGLRTIISDISQGSGLNFDKPRSVEFDLAGNVFVLDPGRLSLVGVDQTSGDRTTIFSGAPAPVGTSLGGLAILGSQAFTTYGFAIDQYDLIQIDLTTGNSTVLSGPTLGTGPEFYKARSVVVNSAGDTVYILDLNGIIYSVDLSTGNRSIVSR